MNNFGPRVIVNILAGVLACFLWMRFAQPFWRGTPWEEMTAHLGAIAWAIGLLYPLSYVIPTLRRRLRLPFILPASALVALIGFWQIGQEFGREQARLLSQTCFIPAVLLAGPLLVSSVSHQIWLSRWFREVFRFGDGDNARWSTRSDYNAREMPMPRTWNGGLGWTDRILLGVTTFRHDVSPRLVWLTPSVHLYTVGMSNSGKSATAQWPNYAIYGGAALIVDMKGEHALMTAKRRAELGEVTIANPLGVHGLPSCQCNLLAGIDETTDEGRRQISEIGKAIVIPEDNTHTGTHFSDNAKTLLDAVNTWVCHTQPEETRNLVTSYRLINSQDPATGVYDPAVWLDLMAEMSECPLGVCAMAAKLMDNAGDREGGSFLTTLSKSIKFMAPAGMQHFLSGVTNPLRDLPTKAKAKPTFYVVVGLGNEIDYSRYIRLMVAMGVYYLREDYRRTGQAAYPKPLIGLDEYALYAKGLDCITTGFGNLREVATLWVCTQKNSMVREVIKSGLDLLLQNSTVQVFGVANDDDDMAAWVSNHLGQHVVRKKKGPGIWSKEIQREKQPLMTRRAVQDTLRQHSANQFIFPADGGPPMWLHRRAYKRFKIGGKQVFKAFNLAGVYDNVDPKKGKPK
ncbi:Type IV secretory system Conjugative DNA transfer [Botrimarina colliarenosi]|uniref:Type IV secretory system Conjugative DNA transfer n=1 Tax=Botrimarina colliarenosi TaxID=2528001 RepID=A0A5C6AC78_9BACT|nr:type IV secretory system conjugative DNA transfer family protein [Botrimarina colliarenosi]TWT96928.1 Type IV secretory system Conjugative DNA transfer [Botrimarina colliarenosi]